MPRCGSRLPPFHLCETPGALWRFALRLCLELRVLTDRLYVDVTKLGLSNTVLIFLSSPF